jgi:GMP synthase-like glutamine amidotransferase
VVFSVFDVVRDEYPESLDACDGYLTTGSAASVYDDEVWLGRLMDFVRKLHSERRAFVGICFGHQLIAEALGGKVGPSPRGWGVGSKSVLIDKALDWMIPEAESIRLLLSHQDQIEELPPGAVVIGGNGHCPYSIITAGETFLGIQGHPEFTPEYARALMLGRGKERIARQITSHFLIPPKNRRSCQIPQTHDPAPVATTHLARARSAFRPEARSLALEEPVNERLAAEHRPVGEIAHPAPQHFPHRHRSALLDFLLDPFAGEPSPCFHHAPVRCLPAGNLLASPEQQDPVFLSRSPPPPPRSCTNRLRPFILQATIF